MKQEENILLSKWLAGTILPEELQALEKEVNLNRLAQVLEQQKQFELSTEPVETMWKDFEGKVAMSSTPEKQTTKKFSFLKWTIVLLLLTTFAIGVFYYWQQQPEKLITPPAAPATKIFAEGTKVELSPGSSLAFKTEDWRTERTIELQGQAFFDVTKGLPMFIHTKAGTIAVLGTQFDVWEMGAWMRVQCFEGKVKVRVGQESKTLEAMEMVFVNKNNLSVVSAFSETKPDWKRKERVYQKIPLKLVLKDLERFYAIEFDASAVPLNDAFSGVFPTQDLEKALTYLTRSMNWQYEQNDKLIYLKPTAE
ncbi:MAG: FecR family protein [Saprospiraceae bacterium]